VVSVVGSGVDVEEDLAEFRELLRTAGVAPIQEVIQRRENPHPRTYVGSGKLAEVIAAAKHSAVESVIIDDELTPTQQRNLEDVLKLRVIDRTQLILDIFAQHAHTAEGKLQVELAQLEYNLPRMRGMWQHLERLGGGIGTRGPGESQLETDRRLARRRVGHLQRRLTALEQRRATQRQARRRSSKPLVALAGYTNVGKSTLLNALTGSAVSVENRLFQTLDPATRGFQEAGRQYLLTDTVGFIRRLPHELVEGFKATLEEMLAADLILHVVDANASDERLDEMVAAVGDVLREIGADHLPCELVINKIDAVDLFRARQVENRFPGSLAVSAMTGEGLDSLKARIADRFQERFQAVQLHIPHTDGARVAELYSLGAPIEQRKDGADGVSLLAKLAREDIQRFAEYVVHESEPPAQADSGQ
jgi:GTP-binding protein HflX